MDEAPDDPPTGAASADTLRALHGATRQMVQAEARGELFDVVTDTATAVLDFKYSTVRRYDEDAEQLVPEAVSDSLQQLDGTRQPYDRSETIQWQAFDRSDLITVQDVSDVDDAVDRGSSGSMIVIPLDDFGVLTIGSPTPQRITEADAELASVFGANVETALDRVDQLRELRARQQELKEKTTRLERFAGKVAHELRNPVNIASGHLNRYETTNREEHLDAVNNALRRMEGLIEDIVALAKPEANGPNQQSLSVGAIAEDCWAEVETGGLDLEVKTSQTVTADRRYLEQIFENLFRNAIEHAGAGTTVTIGSCPNGFYVADDGPGLDGTIEQTAFDAGVSTVDHGAGLGLHVVNELCARHGWRVKTTTSEDGGARFEISTHSGGTDTHNYAGE